MPVRLIALWTVVAMSGCALSGPPRTAAERAEWAAAHEREHCGARDGNDERLLSPAAVVQVEPYYTAVRVGKTALRSIVTGARMLVRPAPGLTRALLAYVVECHRARRVLERVDEPELPSDPFLLPDGWVELAVLEDGDHFVIELRGIDADAGTQILARAHAWAGR